MFEANTVRILLGVIVAVVSFLYIYTAFQNSDEVKIKFLGEERKLNKTSLVLICFVDGLVMGVMLGYILFAS